MTDFVSEEFYSAGRTPPHSLLNDRSMSIGRATHQIMIRWRKKDLNKEDLDDYTPPLCASVSRMWFLFSNLTSISSYICWIEIYTFKLRDGGNKEREREGESKRKCLILFLLFVVISVFNHILPMQFSPSRVRCPSLSVTVCRILLYRSSMVDIFLSFWLSFSLRTHTCR